MPQLHFERSSVDPAIFYFRRHAPNGNWSRKMSIRAPHELRIFLQTAQLSADEIVTVLSLPPGSSMTVDTP